MKKLTELNTQAQKVFSLINTGESIARLSPKEEFQELFDWVVLLLCPASWRMQNKQEKESIEPI